MNVNTSNNIMTALRFNTFIQHQLHDLSYLEQIHLHSYLSCMRLLDFTSNALDSPFVIKMSGFGAINDLSTLAYAVLAALDDLVGLFI